MKGIIRGREEDGKGNGKLKNEKRETLKDDLIVRGIWTIMMNLLKRTVRIGTFKKTNIDPVLDGLSSSLANRPIP